MRESVRENMSHVGHVGLCLLGLHLSRQYLHVDSKLPDSLSVLKQSILFYKLNPTFLLMFEWTVSGLTSPLSSTEQLGPSPWKVLDLVRLPKVRVEREWKISKKRPEET